MPEVVTMEQRFASVAKRVSWARTQAPATVTDEQIAELIFRDIFPEPAASDGLAERIIKAINGETHAKCIRMIRHLVEEHERQKELLFDALLATTHYCDLVSRAITKSRTKGELADMLEPHLETNTRAQELRLAAIAAHKGIAVTQ